jgi:hypothetical protein
MSDESDENVVGFLGVGDARAGRIIIVTWNACTIPFSFPSLSL